MRDLIIRLTAYRHVITDEEGLGFKLMRSKLKTKLKREVLTQSCAAQEGSMFLIRRGG